MTDMVNHPPHYEDHPSGIECIEITRNMDFDLGNALKYIWRADSKGRKIEDLKKAIWYLNDARPLYRRHALPSTVALQFQYVIDKTPGYNLPQAMQQIFVLTTAPLYPQDRVKAIDMAITHLEDELWKAEIDESK
jgi:hypothetical protein